MRRPSALQCHTAGLAAAFIALVAGMATWTARDHLTDVCVDAVVTHATKMDIFNRQNVPQVRDFIDTARGRTAAAHRRKGIVCGRANGRRRSRHSRLSR